METVIRKHKRGEKFSLVEKGHIIGKLVDALSQGYYSINRLSKETGLTKPTVELYKPLASELIAKQFTTDRNVIRNLQIQRTYNIIERLVTELEQAKNPAEKSIYYNQIYKFSSHLALITGLNIETHVNLDHKQLVIIRPAKKNITPVIDMQSDNIINTVDAAGDIPGAEVKE